MTFLRVCSTEGCGGPLKAKGLCHRCYSRERYRKTKYQTAWRARPENIERCRARERAFRHSYVGKRTGFSAELEVELHIKQGGRCAICIVELVLSGKGATHMCRDHDHAARKPRGLLCSTCNLSLGQYERHQRPRGLRIAPYEDYLAKPPVSW